MSRTLHLAQRLLARGRKLHRLGVDLEAFRLLNRLVGFPELPPGAAQEVQERLARLSLKRRRFARVRRHLAALLLRQPQNPKYHYLMSRAAAADPRCSPGRALAHCRRAVQLAPGHAGYLSTLGRLALRQGREEEGLGALRRALELAPDAPRVVRRVARGLSLAGRADEARAVLLAARFRNGTDARFRRLWQDFQFEQLRLRQRRERRARAAGQPDEGPVLLPFVRLEASRPAAEGPEVVRVDGPSLLPAPHLPRPLRRPDQRHAQ
jgi:tetratricopeptide (TPR) repeat protein